VKVLPTLSWEEMVSMFRTTRVVPVGIVAAKEDAIQAQLAIAIRMNLLLVMFGLGLLIHAGFEARLSEF
jgi:hypothetical protein